MISLEQKNSLGRRNSLERNNSLERSNNSLEPKKEYPDTVLSLLIPMREKPLLLPTVAIAEIFTGTFKSKPGPSWILGRLPWRGLEVPVVSFEGLNDQPVPVPSGPVRLGIINRCSDNKTGLPFYALWIHGIPKLTRIAPKDIVEETEKTLGAEAVRVIVNGVSAVIPDLEYVEKQVCSAGCF